MEATTSPKITVILDTDIGSDIDDTWALAQLLNSPEFNIPLIVTSTGDTRQRAQIVGKLLTLGKRTDVDIGLGVQNNLSGPGSHYKWAESFDLSTYSPGLIHKDGIKAMSQLIEKATIENPITLLCIAPLTNISEILKRNPEHARKCKIVAMLGSIKKKTRTEFNLAMDVQAAKEVFAAPWQEITITPLDTCALARIDGDRYVRVAQCTTELLKGVLDATAAWASGMPGNTVARSLKQDPTNPSSPLIKSSVLFDCVAVYLAHAQDFFRMRKMKIRIDGLKMVEDETNGTEINVALEWVNLNAFLDFLVERLGRTNT